MKEKKGKVRRELRKLRKGIGSETDYKKGKLKYKELCAKKKEENERWEKRVMEVKREGEVWEIVNRERKRRRINEEIEMEKRREHFMRLLGGYRVGW